MPRLMLMVLALVLLPLNAFGAEPENAERWYIVQMQGQRAGWMRETVVTREGRIESAMKMSLTIKRGEAGVTIGVESGFVETEDGKPVSMTTTMQLGAMPTTTEYRFGEESVAVFETIGKAGRPTMKDPLPLPEGEWLTPRAAERLMAEKVAAGETEISVRTVDPTSGVKPITTTSTLLERTNLEVVGKTVPAIKWKSTVDLYPGIETVAFTDERGRAVRTETNMGGIKLTVILADRDLARAKVDPPELLMSTLITPDRAIENERTLRRAVFVIESTGEALPDIPSHGAQRFERIDAKSGRLTVDLDAPAAAPADEADDARFVDCSRMITCGDEQVKDLVERALKGAKIGADAAPAARAEVMRAFVYGYINKKSLDVGFASAAEVARTRSGDCSEHAVLLCALLRSTGVPARVMSGLVYVDGFAGQREVFGYHMWAQALLESDGEKRWVDLDGSLSATEPSDATHIGLSATSLADDDTTNSLVRLAPLIGTLKIRVESPK